MVLIVNGVGFLSLSLLLIKDHKNLQDIYHIIIYYLYQFVALSKLESLLNCVEEKENPYFLLSIANSMTEKSIKRLINESKAFNLICIAFPGMRGFRNKDHEKKHCTPLYILMKYSKLWR